MKINTLAVIICTILFAVSNSFAQHNLEVDDGAGHFTTIMGGNPGGKLTLPSGNGILLLSYTGTSSLAWLGSGNSGTNPTSDPLTFNMGTNTFLGTTDNKELDFVTNGQVRARFKESTGDTTTSGAFEPGLGVTYSLGTLDRPWKSLVVSPGTITFTSSTRVHGNKNGGMKTTATSTGNLSFDVNTNTFNFDHPLNFAAGGTVTTGSVTITGLTSTNGGMIKADPTGLLLLADTNTDFQLPLTVSNGLTKTGRNVALGGSLTSDVNINANSKNVYITNPGDFGIGISSSTTGLLEVQCSTKTAIRGFAGGSAGSAGDFSQNNATNASHTVVIATSGTGNALDATTSGTGWAGHFNGSSASSKGIYASGAAGQTGLQVNSGSVLLSHTNQASGAFAVGAGTNAVVAVSSGAAANYNITLNTGTAGQMIYVYNGDALRTAAFVAGTSALHPQNTGPATIIPGNTVLLIYVTNAAGSGWVTK